MRNEHVGGAGRRAAAIAVAVGLLLTACSRTDSSGGEATPPGTTPTNPATALGTISGPPDGATPVEGGKLAFGIEAEPEGLDPTRYAFSSSGNFVASAVFDPLATLDANGNGVPYLATSIDSADGGSTWTITLPTGVLFHDGTALTAQVVADNFAAYRASIIKGLYATVTDVTVRDDTHVVVTLSEPFAAWPTALASQGGYIVAEAMLKDPQYVDKPIGTGPFVATGHQKDKVWSFRKNPTYWRKGLPHLDAIDFLPVPDNGARLKMLRDGDLDVINARSPQEILDLRQATDLKRVENASGEEEFLTLNTSSEPFNSLTARRAVAAAIDSERWRTEIDLGVDQPANSPFGPGQLGYLADNGYPKADLAEAKRLVAQYQQETGKPLAFELDTQLDINVQQESQLFQTMLEAAGIKVTVVALPQINLIAKIAAGGYQMGRFRLFGFPNPDMDANAFWRSANITPGGVSLNFPRYANPAVDAAITRATGSTDPSVRASAYQTINKAFATDVPYLWLGRATWELAANPKVNGLYAAANSTIQTVGPKTWVADLWLQG